MTVNLPDDVARRLAAEAARRGITPEQVALEAIEAQFPAEGTERPARPQPGRERFGFIGLGDSGPGGGDIGRRHDEILREHFATKTARDV